MYSRRRNGIQHNTNKASKNIAIFIDYDNVSICLEKYYELYADNERKDLKTKFINIIKNIFKNDRIITFKAFADFEKVDAGLTVLQKNQVELRHIYSSNQRKNASDIALSVDVIKSLYSKNTIEKYVLISSDSDMLPVINEIRYFAKDPVVIYSKYGSVEGYENFVPEYFIIEDLLGLDKYVPIEVEKEVDNNLNYYLNLLNDGIKHIFTKHQNVGTANKTNLTEFLYQRINMVRQDILFIIEYLLKKDFLREWPVPGNKKFKRILINMSTVKNFNNINSQKISIPNTPIIDISDYK